MLKDRQKQNYAVNLLDVSQMVSSLFEKMDEVGEIKLSLSQGTAQLSLQAAKKNGKLTEILAAAASVTHKMKETKILHRVQKRKLQIKQNAKTEFMDSELIIRCRNSSLSWTEAYNRFIAKAIDVPKKISVASIQYAAEKVENETFVSSEDIAVDLDLESKNDMIEALLSNFPIMQISRGKTSVLIDFKGLLLHEDAFPKLLSVENPIVEVETDLDNSSEVRYYGPRRKAGRKPLHEKFPALVEIVTNFVKQHSFSAHDRRRETSGTGTGVTLQAIRDHVIREIPNLDDVSRQTLQYLMVAPRKGTHASPELQRTCKCTNTKDRKK